MMQEDKELLLNGDPTAPVPQGLISNRPEPHMVRVLTRDPHDRLHAAGTVIDDGHGDAYITDNHGTFRRVSMVEQMPDGRVKCRVVKRLNRKEKKAAKRMQQRARH